MEWWHKRIHPTKRDPRVEDKTYIYDNKVLNFYGATYLLGTGFTCYDGKVRYAIVHCNENEKGINRTSWPLPVGNIESDMIDNLNVLEGHFQKVKAESPQIIYTNHKRTPSGNDAARLTDIVTRLSKLEAEMKGLKDARRNRRPRPRRK